MCKNKCGFPSKNIQRQKKENKQKQTQQKTQQQTTTKTIKTHEFTRGETF